MSNTMAYPGMPDKFEGEYSEWLALLKVHHPESGRIENVLLASNPPIPMAHAYVGEKCVSTWVGKASPVYSGW